ncbi:hypothetical protein Plec18170_009774 [Paecilomyces lecythidis]
MSGVDFDSLVSSTITVLDSAKSKYSHVSGDRRLPETFHEAGQGLLLIVEAFQSIKSQIDASNAPRDCAETMTSLEACNAKSMLAEGIFDAVFQAPETERFDYYKKAVRQHGKCNRVESLVEQMMNATCDITGDSAIKAAMGAQVKQLREAIEKLSKMEPSVPNEQSGDTFISHGSGGQFNATGGTQNNNTGSGTQFSAATFRGPVHFGRNWS